MVIILRPAKHGIPFQLIYYIPYIKLSSGKVPHVQKTFLGSKSNILFQFHITASGANQTNKIVGAGPKQSTYTFVVPLH